jgi:hypothetical protein
VTAAEEALPRVQGYLTSHPDTQMVRLRVDDPHGEEVLTVPRASSCSRGS